MQLCSVGAMGIRPRTFNNRSEIAFFAFGLLSERNVIPGRVSRCSRNASGASPPGVLIAFVWMCLRVLERL